MLTDLKKVSLRRLANVSSFYKKSFRFLSFITIFVILLAVQTGCGGKQVEPDTEMFTPFLLNKYLAAKVMDFKTTVEHDDLPRMKRVDEKSKYLLVRLQILHTGKHYGIKPISFDSAVQKVEFLHEKVDKPIRIDISNIAEEWNVLGTNMATEGVKPLKAQERKAVWLVTTIPRQLSPPYIVHFIPKKGGKEVSVKLDVM